MNESFETLKPTEDVSCMGLGQVETKTLFYRTILDKIFLDFLRFSKICKGQFYTVFIPTEPF